MENGLPGLRRIRRIQHPLQIRQGGQRVLRRGKRSRQGHLALHRTAGTGRAAVLRLLQCRPAQVFRPCREDQREVRRQGRERLPGRLRVPRHVLHEGQHRSGRAQARRPGRHDPYAGRSHVGQLLHADCRRCVGHEFRTLQHHHRQGHAACQDEPAYPAHDGQERKGRRHSVHLHAAGHRGAEGRLAERKETDGIHLFHRRQVGRP